LDKGYQKQIEICKQANITTIVAQPEQGKVTKTVRLRIIGSPISVQSRHRYLYLSENTKTGSWHKKTTDRDSYNFKNTEPQNAKHVRKTFMH
jgi:hypothetical protein